MSKTKKAILIASTRSNTMTEATTKTILTPSLQASYSELQDLVQQGYVINDNEPPYVFMGTQYCIEMIKDSATTAKHVQRLQDAVDGRPKFDRTEHMKKARAARGQGGSDE
jgi:hypothetical protein